LSNPENSRAVFSPSEILRGLSGAARDLPPLYAPRPPSPGVLPRAAAVRPPLSPAAARPGRGERTNQGGPLPAARSLFLLARHQEEARTITLC
jgi:hypothetical protein